MNKFEKTKAEHDEHIKNVVKNLTIITNELDLRKHCHDFTKNFTPEIEGFADAKELKSMTYGSKEYENALANLKTTLDHHYKNNRHHPEHFENGIKGMNLVDLVEMLCDWVAATKRHADGDINKSIVINKARFGYDDVLESIFNNTVKLFGI